MATLNYCEDGAWRCYNYAIEDGFIPKTEFIVEDDELYRD
jgi:hypothetical protein